MNRPQKEYLIIYHKEDNDGVFSAAIFEDYILNSLHFKLEDLCFIGADYNNLAEFSKDDHNAPEELHKEFKHIIMTDISFNDPKYMKALYDEFKNDFIWIDHHAPIIKESYKLKFDNAPGIRDTQRSAILNAWKFLYDQFDEAYNEKRVPELLRILSAWDSWSYEREGYDFEYVKAINKATTLKYDLQLHNIRPIICALRNVYVENKDDKIMNITAKDSDLIEELFTYGTTINNYEDIMFKSILETSGDCSWEVRFDDKDKGRPLFHKACAIFHQGATNSTMFKSLKKKGIDHGLVFKHQPNGNWTMSMYNIDENSWVHCGDLLKERYNGGGHKGAAGCTFTEDQFIEILKRKII